MPEDPNIPLPDEQKSPRAVYQVLAERVGVVQPGVTISEELFAFAEAVVQTTAQEEAISKGKTA